MTAKEKLNEIVDIVCREVDIYEKTGEFAKANQMSVLKYKLLDLRKTIEEEHKGVGEQ